MHTFKRLQTVLLCVGSSYMELNSEYSSSQLCTHSRDYKQYCSSKDTHPFLSTRWMVTTGYRAKGACMDECILGHDQISHSSLIYNSTNNTLYIRDNCLCLRGRVITVWYNLYSITLAKPLKSSQSIHTDRIANSTLTTMQGKYLGLKIA